MTTEEATRAAYRTAVVDSYGDRDLWRVRISRIPAGMVTLGAPRLSDTPHDVRAALKAWTRQMPPAKFAPSRVSNVKHELDDAVATWEITVDRVDQMGQPLLSDLPADACESLHGWLELTP